MGNFFEPIPLYFTYHLLGKWVGDYCLTSTAIIMANYVKRELPNLHGEGKKKAYYKIETNRNFGCDELADFMSKSGMGMPKAAVKAVLLQLSSAMANLLALGYTVSIDGLGIVSLKIGPKKNKRGSDAYDFDNKLTPSNLEVTGVNLKVDKDFLKEINRQCRLENRGVRSLTRSIYSPDERLQRAKDYLAENMFIRVKMYALLNNLSVSVAQRELKKLAEDPQSGITSVGRGSSKMYVLDNNNV